MRRGHGWSMPQGLLIHLLLHRDLSQRPAIITLVAANPPFLDPFFLDVRLAAFRADEHSLFIVHEPFFLHCLPRSWTLSLRVQTRLAQAAARLQAEAPRARPALGRLF